ncbi:MAG: ABC transporter ATP-binding protein [Bernardetiaceae bacterium]|jgi:iron(III) transport system ATP-binding protein|nr:ABC transporter ATP-binding protein [Bernardetiaceae bacterium]
MSFFRAENLALHYPGQPEPALQQVGFALAPGEVVGLVGRSGAGKSTLLRLLAGLANPDHGQIWLDGQLVKGPAHQLVPGHKHIALLRQDYGLAPTMNVFDNITYPLLAYPRAYQQQRVAELLALCRLQNVARKFPRELSGGEQQRVGLARALARPPKVLLLDEPFGSLDEGLRHEIRQDLRQIIRQGQITCLLVTHHPADALALADRVGALQAGRLVQLGAPRPVYAQPVSGYVAQLFGPANLLTVNDLRKIYSGPLPPWPGEGTVCLRPEHLLPTAPSEADFTSTVEELFFLGHGQMALVRAAPLAQPLQVWLPGPALPPPRLPLRVEETAVHLLPS